MGRIEMYKSRIRKLEDRAKRIALGMTQESLAAAVGIGRSMIAQIERGSKLPNVVLGRDIARVLQCKLDDLVSDIQ